MTKVPPLRMMMPLKVLPTLISLKVVIGARRKRSPEARIQIEILALRGMRWGYVQVVPTVGSFPLVTVALEVVASLSMIFGNT